MNDFFYLYAIVFIIRSIRAIIRSNKIATYQYETLQNVTFQKTDFNKQVEDIRYLNDKIKKKPIFIRILNTIDFFWLIAGIIFAVESYSFILLLSIDIFSRFISMAFKTKQQFVFRIISTNILDLLIVAYILYSHFNFITF